MEEDGLKVRPTQGNIDQLKACAGGGIEQGGNLSGVVDGERGTGVDDAAGTRCCPGGDGFGGPSKRARTSLREAKDS
jgi:hypothetical protein